MDKPIKKGLITKCTKCTRMKGSARHIIICGYSVHGNGPKSPTVWSFKGSRPSPLCEPHPNPIRPQTPISSAHYSLSLTSPNKNTLLVFLLLESSHVAFFQGRKTSHPNNGTTYKNVIAQEKKSSVRNI